MKKTYIVVGENNYWYSLFEAKTQKEIDDEIEFIKNSIRENQYASTGKPIEIHLYEVKLKQTYSI